MRDDDDAVGALEQPRGDRLFLDVDGGLEDLSRLDQPFVGLGVSEGREVAQEQGSQQGKGFPHVVGPWQLRKRETLAECDRTGSRRRRYAFNSPDRPGVQDGGPRR